MAADFELGAPTAQDDLLAANGMLEGGHMDLAMVGLGGGGGGGGGDVDPRQLVLAGGVGRSYASWANLQRPA